MNCRTYPGADCDTDHQLLVATLKVRLGKRQRQHSIPPLDLEELKEDKAVQSAAEVTSRFTALQVSQNEVTPEDVWKGTVAVGPPRPSNFCYICFIIFVLILFIFYPRNLLLYEWVPADSWLCSSIQLIPFPFRLVTWSAVCHVTELSGGRVAGGLAGHVECSWSVQVLGQRMRGKAP